MLVFAETDRDVTAHRAVFGLVAGISRDVTADRKSLLLVVRLLTLPLAQPQVKLPLFPGPVLDNQPPILMHMSVPGMK